MTPLRADAERNRRRLVDAGAELFAARGLDTSLEEVARHAGVGTTTAYRRFDDHEDLVDAVYGRLLDKFVALSEQALHGPEPWTALRGFLEAVLVTQASDLGFQQMLHGPHGKHEVAQRRRVIAAAVTALVERAQAAGQLRPDATSADLVLLLLMVGTVAERTRHVDPEAWRRSFALVLDGLRHPTTTAPPLPLPALTTDQVEAAMHHVARPGQPRARQNAESGPTVTGDRGQGVG